MPSEISKLDRYGLAFDRFETIDLQDCFAAYTPNRIWFDVFLDYKMINSPHAQIFSLLQKHGKRWLKQQYIHTRYNTMMQGMDKGGSFPQKILAIYESMKSGYLFGRHADSHIVVLEVPFAQTRYNRDVPNQGIEIWSGHHRGGCLLAMNQPIIKAIVAKDAHPGSCHSAGKVHDLCRRLS